MKHIRMLLKSNRGATSVLIMVMMIILMVFGLAALTTSAVSKKLAQKNANWLEEYYLLQGKAEKLMAEIEDKLYLEDSGLDSAKLEDRVNLLVKERQDISFETLNQGDTLYKLDAVVTEEAKEVPKSIQMQFLVVREESGYKLKVSKWTQTQSEIFSEEDELHFSDIKMEQDKK